MQVELDEHIDAWRTQKALGEDVEADVWEGFVAQVGGKARASVE
jgi:hypothetical protein